MGEAWFMGDERRMFHELRGDLSALTARQLQEPLHEIASGTSSFGPLREWNDWYHFLLGQLIGRSHENFVSSLLESLLTGFMAIHPNGVHAAPYPEFRDDALATLGRCMMAPGCWHRGQVVIGSMLHRSNNNPRSVWCWWDASGDLSGSMYFCLKYLPTNLVSEWFGSVLAIASPHWRAQVLVWLVGSHEMLTGRIGWPSELKIDAYPAVVWAWSHCLRPEMASQDVSGARPVTSFLPPASREAVLTVVNEYFSEETYLGWLESIDQVPCLSDELGHLPSAFEDLYVGKTNV